MSRAKPELRARALALAEAHPEMSSGAIARAVGASTSTVWRWRNPERAAETLRKDVAALARRRAWGDEPRNRLPCIDCGGITSRVKGQQPRRCRECHARVVNEESNPRRTRIQELWHAGLTQREIAEAVGRSEAAVCFQISKMREDGWDMPRRKKWSEEGLRAVAASAARRYVP